MSKTDIKVSELVDMIKNGELRLPEMQRRYVWRSTRVRIFTRFIVSGVIIKIY